MFGPKRPGQVIPQDKLKALALFLEAAQKGHPRAMFNAANMLEYGDGVPQDVKSAFRWYQEICRREPTNKEALQKCRKLQALI